MTENTKNTELKATLDFAEKHIQPTVLTIKGQNGEDIQLIASNGNFKLTEVKPLLAPYMKNPERKKGTLYIQSSQSFIDVVNRFKYENSALFLNKQNNRLEAVFDYNKPSGGEAMFGEHRAIYDFPLSEQWQRWTQKSGEAMSQMEFAEFLSDNIVDVLPALPREAQDGESEADANLRDLIESIGGKCAGPAEIRNVANGIEFNAEQKVIQGYNLDTGETQITYEERHTPGKNMGASVKVPNMFLIGIPVFEDGGIYRLPVRLKYRLRSGAISWSFEIYREEKAIKDALVGAANEVKEGTGLPLYFGTPESR